MPMDLYYIFYLPTIPTLAIFFKSDILLIYFIFSFTLNSQCAARRNTTSTLGVL